MSHPLRNHWTSSGASKLATRNHGAVIADEALAAAVQLSANWLPERHWPDKALDLLDEACARARIPTISSSADLDADLVVTSLTVAEVLARWVGMPVQELLMCREN